MTAIVATSPIKMLKHLKKSSHSKVAKKISRDESWPLAIGCPAAVSLLLSARNVKLKSDLHILIFGAKQLEILDKGAWYGLITEMLVPKIVKNVKVTAVGESIELLNNSTLNKESNLLKVEFNQFDSYSAFLEATTVDTPDVAISFDPKQNNMHSEPPESFLAYLKNNEIPTGFTTRHKLHHTIERAHYILKGIGVAPQLVSNPFALPSVENIGWSSYIGLFDFKEYELSLLANESKVDSFQQITIASVEATYQMKFGSSSPFAVGSFIESQLWHAIDGIALDQDGSLGLAVKHGDSINFTPLYTDLASDVKLIIPMEALEEISLTSEDDDFIDRFVLASIIAQIARPHLDNKPLKEAC